MRGGIDGIVFDDSGNVVEYHVLKHHPGDTRMSISPINSYDRFLADAVIHWFRCDRPGQARGIPDIMPALPLFSQLRRFTLARVAACATVRQMTRPRTGSHDVANVE